MQRAASPDVMELFAEDPPVDEMQAMANALAQVEEWYFGGGGAEVPHCKLCGADLTEARMPVTGTMAELPFHQPDCPMHAVRKALSPVRGDAERSVRPPAQGTVTGVDQPAPGAASGPLYAVHDGEMPSITETGRPPEPSAYPARQSSHPDSEGSGQ